MGVVWFTVLEAGTSGHQRFDAPVINENKAMNSERFRSWRMLNTQNPGCVECLKGSAGRRGGRGKHPWCVRTLGVGMPSPKLRRAEAASTEEKARAWLPEPQENVLHRVTGHCRRKSCSVWVPEN